MLIIGNLHLTLMNRFHLVLCFQIGVSSSSHCYGAHWPISVSLAADMRRSPSNGNTIIATDNSFIALYPPGDLGHRITHCIQ